jgi:hypothetical protein
MRRYLQIAFSQAAAPDIVKAAGFCLAGVHAV